MPVTANNIIDTVLFEQFPLVQLTSSLYRLRAPNPGPMTGSGTNTYLVKSGNEFIVIDPGPNDTDHVNAILQIVDGPVNIIKILVTHMHPDHSPAAGPLTALSKAPVYGKPPVEDPFQDTTCDPDQVVEHNELICLGDISIRCVHTPGHVDNHVCYLLENDDVLMTGDHIMQGSTVVIIPPHGNMKSYIESLQLLLDYPIQQFAPGHGELITTPADEIRALVQHRLKREQKVIDKFSILGQANLKQLTPLVYDDVDISLHPIAELSLHAHLIKLQQEERVVCTDGQWLWLT